ncbi:MAG: 2,3,4,5-tetrahydropyridine-2,6-dicarboxylate N-succinyltransferase [Alphaproteobacteria bacterium MarineAlpha9_Bin4]|nr:2,3,4,5-tetrahydropyridine-2,6-dicarboxylate N-succinyltransferase [Pelagibacterales bacterium]PPR27250.1 MAG: 2,3,4,5-tetrahydropyridine-2,6-dicarboxylate N-succinyltransferase [Alphaproteobacteria bacterium MarineAlpha9_Bin4]
MNKNSLKESIEKIWSNRKELSKSKSKKDFNIIMETIKKLDNGEIRVSEKINGQWILNQWVKKAVLLSFQVTNQKLILNGPGKSYWWDKVPSKFEGWKKKDFTKAGFRIVPNAVVRKGSFIDKGAVLMPSFTNIGAYVGSSTMIDTWATVGSCAQIGKNCHISGGAGIGGVLEPLQSSPVIIEDNCFVGARSEVAEGVIVEEGSVLSMGVYIGASTKIIDRKTGKIFYGKVPKYSVVVPGNFNDKKSKVSLYCAVIVKTVDEKTRSKTSINELLRN